MTTTTDTVRYLEARFDRLSREIDASYRSLPFDADAVARLQAYRAVAYTDLAAAYEAESAAQVAK